MWQVTPSGCQTTAAGMEIQEVILLEHLNSIFFLEEIFNLQQFLILCAISQPKIQNNIWLQLSQSL